MCKTNLKTVMLSAFAFSLAVASAENFKTRYVGTEYPDVVNSNRVTVTLRPEGEIPEWMAVVVQTNKPIDDWGKKHQEAMAAWQNERKTNSAAKFPKIQPPSSDRDYDKAQWLPFQTNLVVDLGPGDGKRGLMFGFKYKGQTRCDSWNGSSLAVQTALPFIAFTNPKGHITSQPVIQLRGFVTKDVRGIIEYDLFDQNGTKTASGEGLVNDKYFDKALWQNTTNYFTCYDVSLNPGTNTFVIRCKDSTGLPVHTNFVVVFTTAGDTSPPIFKLDWPQDGMNLSGSKFNLRGWCDDPTAIVTAFVCGDDGKSGSLEGFVGRDRYLWIEHIPLVKGRNHLTVVITDAAQNSSLTNLTVTKSSLKLYMHKVHPNRLLQPQTTVTGFCSLTNRTVFVNGVKAHMNPEGFWMATNVPVNSPNGGGTATFNLTTDYDEDVIPANSWLPTIFGEPTNSWRAGISFPSVSTNEYNHYPIYLGLTNMSGRSFPRQWMLPTEAARFSLHLYDQNNQEVARQEHLRKSGQVLPNNLNIYHLGRNELTNIDGVISFSTNSTACIASLKLDEHFKLPPPGKYRLEIVARLFEIAGDGQLIPFTFPPISTSLQIIDQPSEMTFYLNELERQGKLVWGAELHSLCIGVAHGLNGWESGKSIPVEIFLQNNSTNDFRNGGWMLPNPNEQFDLSLYDSSGKEISKTTLGKQQGQPLSLTGQNPRKPPGVLDEVSALLGFGNGKRGHGPRPVYVPAKDVTDLGQLNLNDYFEIKSPGKYQLTYQQRFYRWNTNSTLQGITIPTVTVPLEIDHVSGK